MPVKEDFQAIFEQLKAILEKHELDLIVTQDEPASYSLNTPWSEAYRKEVFFGAVHVKKSYVSYYLMPVYMYPDLLDDISDRLKKRMQGKSCFNFKSSDLQLFNELAQLTERSVERLKQEDLL
jgi:hypothetical protein